MTARLRVLARLAVAIAGAALAVAMTAAPAAAHAKVVRTAPADGASIDGHVKAVTVVFDDPVEVVPHSLVVTGATGAPLTTGAPRVIGDRTLRAALLDRLVPGRYFVAWRILSDDGHVESGSFGFSVAVPGAAPAANAAPLPPAAPGQPTWPVIVAAALAAAAVGGAGLVVARGLRAVRAASAPSPYPLESLRALDGEADIAEAIAARR